MVTVVFVFQDITEQTVKTVSDVTFFFPLF